MFLWATLKFVREFKELLVKPILQYFYIMCCSILHTKADFVSIYSIRCGSLHACIVDTVDYLYMRFNNLKTINTH